MNLVAIRVEGGIMQGGLAGAENTLAAPSSRNRGSQILQQPVRRNQFRERTKEGML